MRIKKFGSSLVLGFRNSMTSRENNIFVDVLQDHHVLIIRRSIFISSSRVAASFAKAKVSSLYNVRSHQCYKHHSKTLT